MTYKKLPTVQYIYSFDFVTKLVFKIILCHFYLLRLSNLKEEKGGDTANRETYKKLV